MAIFIVQMFYGVMAISSTSNSVVDKAHVEKEFYYGEFKYDLALHNLNETQHNIVVRYAGNKVYQASRESYYLTNEEEGDPIVFTDSTGRNHYDVYVNFTDYSAGEALEAHGRFMDEYLTGDTPLLVNYADRDDAGTLVPVDYTETELFAIETDTGSPSLVFSIVLFAILAVWFIFRIVKPKENEKFTSKLFRWVLTAGALIFMFI
ncbi:MAG: hypothetical protein IJQ80_08010, partial [Clostridia bacterium]|nr:hypothetical protein [Clostridia bacterium]